MRWWVIAIVHMQLMKWIWFVWLCSLPPYAFETETNSNCGVMDTQSTQQTRPWKHQLVCNSMASRVCECLILQQGIWQSVRTIPTCGGWQQTAACYHRSRQLKVEVYKHISCRRTSPFFLKRLSYAFICSYFLPCVSWFCSCCIMRMITGLRVRKDKCLESLARHMVVVWWDNKQRGQAEEPAQQLRYVCDHHQEACMWLD